MIQVNILEATADFSNLIRLLESKREDCITIERNGTPVAKITPIDEGSVSKRIGARKGQFAMRGDFDADNREIADTLTGDAL